MIFRVGVRHAVPYTIKRTNFMDKGGKMEEKVRQAIEKVRPILQGDGGDIEFVEIQGNVVKVRLKGACSGCPMSQLTLKSVVEQTLKKEVPEIERVETV